MSQVRGGAFREVPGLPVLSETRSLGLDLVCLPRDRAIRRLAHAVLEELASTAAEATDEGDLRAHGLEVVIGQLPEDLAAGVEAELRAHVARVPAEGYVVRVVRAPCTREPGLQQVAIGFQMTEFA